MKNKNYREQLMKNYNVGNFFLEISLDDLKRFDESATMKLRRYPTRFLPAVFFINSNNVFLVLAC